MPCLAAAGYHVIAPDQRLEAISEALDYELIGIGITVTLMEPDGMRTAIGFHHPRSEHPVLWPQASMGARRA
jgi:short-subunit dehydrogenase